MIVAWAAVALDWSAVWQTLIGVQYGWVLVAFGLHGVALLIRTARWGALLWPAEFGFKDRFDALVIGQAANYVSPVPRVGDLVRAYLLGQATGVSKVQALGTVALEKLWDMMMLLLFTLGVSWFFPLPNWLQAPARGLLILTLAALVVTAIILWRQQLALAWLNRLMSRFAPVWQQRLVGLSRSLLQGLAGLQSLPAIVGGAAWSMGVWLIGGVLNYTLFSALDLPAPPVAAFLLLVVLQIGVTIPSLPGKIGLFEGICVVVLGLFGVTDDLAFSYGLILHVVVFLPPIVLGALLSLQLNFRWRQIYQLKELTSPASHD